MKSRASTNPDPAYRGRFAPSPNGPLHFGSLIAATASRLDALAHEGEWWLRIDDIDPPRVVPGAIDQILHQLDGFGFEWDGIVFQSQRHAHYQAAFEQLKADGWLYRCFCSRREVFARHPQGIYDGHCRHHPPASPPDKPPAWRFIPPRARLSFHDLIQGTQHCDCPHELGEFIVRRADGIWGYHLACAVDEMEIGITHVIRGADLMTGSFAQQSLLLALNAPRPHYGHHPVAVNADGIKLSKRARASAIDPAHASQQLWQALNFLGQQPPTELKEVDLATLWHWARHHYRRERIPATLHIHDTATA